ncbi:MAG: hypothetical protein AUH43_23755 [Acidobacteria bacterium 13_1_40CM_65_14]|nr:MAG: hypothetical protein AUH43_23755 [Acidobacteria bacterium 13_1_40CM_65_14]OLC75529.1 MAG: hypothetical protein AUH72_20280 [Acidobacteria bacterium 13_1_40CM_4_65_8]OLD19648.1 MAG: hypothetical protein AUJ01_05590 [Acidobacteria bacterium 13_1_40CM_3_65_5]
MRRLSKFGSALVLATFVASGMVAFSIPVNASVTGGGLSNTTICRFLAYAEAVVSRLPNSDLKVFLLSQIHEEQAEYGCS